MLWGGVADGGGLELRRLASGGVRLAGRFPYGIATTLGRRRMETVAPRAFSPRIEAGENIWLLVGHDPDRPLASREAGTLEIEDREDALTFTAEIGAQLRAAPYVADVLGGLEAGLIQGVSPGFRLADDPGAEDVRSEGETILRTVRKALLYELSLVTWPAYGEAKAQVEARRWSPRDERPDAGLQRAVNRWRA